MDYIITSAIFDTQMMLGEYQFDYGFAAINLHLYSINLFLQLLKLFGDDGNRR